MTRCPRGFRVMRTSPAPSSAGFTLVELLIGSLIAVIVMTVAFQVLVGEQRSSEARRQETNAQQNLRVTLDRVTRDLRLAGYGIDSFLRQPRILDAAPWQVAMNGDISSGLGGEASMESNMEIKLSGGGTYSPGDYPTENLGNEPRYAGGAETVVLGIDANLDGIIDADDKFTDSSCPSDYAIYRGVNGLRTERLAFGLRGPDAYPDGTLPQPLFKYWGDYGGAGLRLWGDDNGDGDLSQTEIANLTPVSVAELSNIVYVDVEVGVFSSGEVLRVPHEHGTEADPFKYMEVSSSNRIRPRNIGVNAANLSACGDPPSRPYSVWVQDTPDDAGESITIHFNASADELNGEEDVTHYFVYRREAGGAYGAAIGQVPAASLSSYSYANDIHAADEANIPVDGVQYYYRVTAWDCKPQESSLSYEAGPVASQPNGSDPPILVKVYDTPCDEGEEVTVVFDQSPDESEGNVSGYRVYRGPLAGDFLAKTLIGYVTSTGAATYTYLDNDITNVAGAPPVNDTQYWYTVRAVNDTIVSVDSNELGPVAANQGLSAAPLESVSDVPFDDGTRLTVSWLRSESEFCVPNTVTGYTLQRKGPVDDHFSDLDFYSSYGDPAYSVVDTSLLAGQPYAYRVVVKSMDDSQPSNELTGIPTNNIDLLPPVNLAADGVPCDASGAIRLTWDRSFHDNGSGDIEYYRLWRREEGGMAYGLVDVILATASDNYYFDDNDSGADPPTIGLTYQYVATAYNETYGNESGYSQSAYCTSASIPDAPYLRSVSDTPGDHGGSITVLFYASDDDGDCSNTVESYQVFRSQEWGDFDEENIVGIVTAYGQSSYTWFDDGSGIGSAPEDGTSYYYNVVAVGDGESSPASNTRGPVVALDDAVVSTILFQDGFESDTGWDHGGYRDDWQRGDPSFKSQTYGDSDPEDAYLGSNVYGTDIGSGGWNGRYRANVNSWLLSPAIDCSEAENVRLVFQRWLNVEQPTYDRAILEVSGTGSEGTWHQIWQNSVEVTDTQWIEQDFDISEYADGAENVFIRFRLETDGSWHYAGWNIDEFTIIGDH
jgi:type II secretory pathway pseudopilin PulG